MIVAGPGPIDDVAGADGDRARAEVGAALPHGHVRGRGASQAWQQDQK